MPDCWLALQDSSRKCIRLTCKLTEPVLAGIIIVSTDMFSEMNFSEDVYAKDSKDTFPRRLTRPYPPYVVDG